MNDVDLGVSYSHNTATELFVLVYLRSEEMIDAKNSRVVVTPPIRAFQGILHCLDRLVPGAGVHHDLG